MIRTPGHGEQAVSGQDRLNDGSSLARIAQSAIEGTLRNITATSKEYATLFGTPIKQRDALLSMPPETRGTEAWRRTARAVGFSAYFDYLPELHGVYGFNEAVLKALDVRVDRTKVRGDSIVLDNNGSPVLLVPRGAESWQGVMVTPEESGWAAYSLPIDRGPTGDNKMQRIGLAEEPTHYGRQDTELVHGFGFTGFHGRDPSPLVSRDHLSLSVADAGLLVDEHSSNGTTIYQVV